MATEQATTIGALVGERLRSLRAGGDEAGRQEDLAAIARRHGLRWRRSTVASIETGQRDVTVQELLLLCMAFSRPLRWWVAGDRSPVPDDMIDLGNGAAAPRRAVAALLSGQSPAEGGDRQRRRNGLLTEQWVMPAAEDAVRFRERAEDEERRARRLWPDVDDDVIVDARLAAIGEAEQKAAKRLDLSSFETALLAIRRWGHGLTEERDARVAEQAPPEASPRSLQALRGHITRALLDELRAEQKEPSQ